MFTKLKHKTVVLVLVCGSWIGWSDLESTLSDDDCIVISQTASILVLHHQIFQNLFVKRFTVLIIYNLHYRYNI